MPGEQSCMSCKLVILDTFVDRSMLCEDTVIEHVDDFSHCIESDLRLIRIMEREYTRVSNEHKEHNEEVSDDIYSLLHSIEKLLNDYKKNNEESNNDVVSQFIRVQFISTINKFYELID